MRGAFQLIEGVHFYRSRYRSRYWGLCDRAFKQLLETGRVLAVQKMWNQRWIPYRKAFIARV